MDLDMILTHSHTTSNAFSFSKRTCKDHLSKICQHVDWLGIKQPTLDFSKRWMPAHDSKPHWNIFHNHPEVVRILAALKRLLYSFWGFPYSLIIKQCLLCAKYLQIYKGWGPWPKAFSLSLRKPCPLREWNTLLAVTSDCYSMCPL